MDRIFKVIAPRNALDFGIKVMIVVLMVVGANFLYFWMFADLSAISPLSVVKQALFLGIPFVGMGFLIVTRQAQVLERLSLLSRKDGLTGLNNRRTFLLLAEKRLLAQQRGVLLLFDADYFKKINDTYGHAAGDQCLKAIAHRLQWHLRGRDVAGRIGGEEFAVFLDDATIEQARTIAGRLVQPIPFDGGAGHAHLTVTMSAGAVVASPDSSLDELLIRADHALYAAKTKGRARMIIWHANLNLPETLLVAS